MTFPSFFSFPKEPVSRRFFYRKNTLSIYISSKTDLAGQTLKQRSRYAGGAISPSEKEKVI